MLSQRDLLIAELDQLVHDRLGAWPPQWEGFHWPGYTCEHTLRVRNLAVQLARREGADPDVVEVAALLHDIRKDAAEHGPEGARFAQEFLHARSLDGAFVGRVHDAIATHAGDNTPESPVENRVLGDADLIDANFGLVATWRFITIRSGRDGAFHDTILGMAEWLPNKDALLTRLLTPAGREIAQRRVADQHAFCGSLMRQAEDGEPGSGLRLLEVARHFHDDRGRHYLATQLDQLEAVVAAGADDEVNASLRHLGLEIAGER